MKKTALLLSLIIVIIGTSFLPVGAQYSFESDGTNYNGYAVAARPNAMVKHGDYIFMATGLEKYADVYSDSSSVAVKVLNISDNTCYNLETVATVEKEGVVATNLEGDEVWYYIPKSLMLDGNYLYVGYSLCHTMQGMHIRNGGIRIYDISNPAAPVDITNQASGFKGDAPYTNEYVGKPLSVAGSSEPTNIMKMQKKGNLIYAGMGFWGLTVLDVSNPRSITRGYADFSAINTATAPKTGGNFFVYNLTIDESENSTIVYVNTRNYLIAYDVTDTANVVRYTPIAIDYTLTTGDFFFCRDGVLYAARNAATETLLTFNITLGAGNVMTATLLYSADMPAGSYNTNIRDFAINGNYAVVTSGNSANNYYCICDISNLATDGTITLPTLQLRKQTYNITKATGELTLSSNTSTVTAGCYGYIPLFEDSSLYLYLQNIGVVKYDLTTDIETVSVKYTYSGDEVTADSITKAGNINIEAKVENYSGANKTPSIVFALYNSETLEMEDVILVEKQVAAGFNDSFTGTLTIPADYTDYKIKAFAFYDLDTIRPIELNEAEQSLE